MRLKSIALLATTVAILASCTKQEFDNNPDPNAHTPGTLAITELTIDGQGAAPITRATMEGGVTDIYAAEPNTAITAFVQGDEWIISYSFKGVSSPHHYANATLGSGGKWMLTPIGDLLLRPTADGESWANATMRIGICAQPAIGETSEHINMRYKKTINASLGTLTGATTHSYYDALIANTGVGTPETDDQGNVLKGMIAIERNTDSPTLGAVRINLTHAGALMRLAPDAIKIDGEPQSDAKTLKGLWAKVSYDNAEFYVPFTQVTVGGVDYWQAITPVGNVYVQGFVTLVGNTTDATTDETIITTLDGNGKELAQNKRYPLAMNVTTTVEAEITFTNPEGLPGWDTEIEL